MWNLKAKQMNKKKKTEKDSDTENKLVLARGEEG